MKSTMRLPALIGAATLLAGCSSMPHKKLYAEPSSGPKARLRISTDGIVRLDVGTVCARWDDPASGVGPNKFDTPLLTVANNDRQLGMPMPMPANPALATTELYVPAGRPLLLHYMNSTSYETKVGNQIRYTTQSCDGVVAFVPEAGADYFSRFTRQGDKCVRGVASMAQPDVKLPDISQPELCAKTP
jgi:hypothetical protein